jgi:phospholipid/cholesterol/gamma-HCH transport system ATP-binding protein
MHILSLPGSGYMSDAIAIAFEQVEKGFGERKVLDKVSFSVARGEALCILGRSGTGKSVTLKLMIGLLQADAGKVLVAGEDMGMLEEEGLAKVRRKMGYLFQSAALFDSFTLSENLAMPLHRLAPNKSREEVKRAVEETLGEVGLAKDGQKMPNALSGGMQKRAGLARALVLQPEILLVDEPASGLDRITASEIDALLMKVKKERQTTMVIVTHDVHGARKIADKFAVLDQGRLLAFGTPAELDQKQDDHLQQFISEC